MTASASVGRAQEEMPVAFAPVMPVLVASHTEAAHDAPRARTARTPSTKSWRGVTPSGTCVVRVPSAFAGPALEGPAAGEYGVGASLGGPGDGVPVAPGVGCAEFQRPAQRVGSVGEFDAYVAAFDGAGGVAGAVQGTGAAVRTGGAGAVGGGVQDAGGRVGMCGGGGGQEGGRGGEGDGDAGAVHGRRQLQSGWPGMGGLSLLNSQSSRKGRSDGSCVTRTALSMKSWESALACRCFVSQDFMIAS